MSKQYKWSILYDVCIISKEYILVQNFTAEYGIADIIYLPTDNAARKSIEVLYLLSRDRKLVETAGYEITSIHLNY